MIQESDGETWFFRRDRSLYGPIADLCTIIDGIACLRIDLQLLYKSKRLEEKDELDFAEALPKLSPTQRSNLRDWLNMIYPQGHDWIERLAR